MNRAWAAPALALALAGCAATQKEPPPKPFAGTRWEAVRDLPIPGEQPWVRFGDGLMEGWGGCNRFSSRYRQDSVGARAIVIGRIDTGRRGCDPSVQAAEMRMLEVLQSVSSYAITADTMTMTGSAGTLRFRAKPAAAAANGEASMTGTRWVGVVQGTVEAAALPRLEFLAGGRLAGFTGCNMLTGTWRTEAGEVRFGPIATTKRFCVGPAGDIEKRLLAALGEDSRVRTEAGKLVVASPSGERFEFAPAG